MLLFIAVLIKLVQLQEEEVVGTSEIIIIINCDCDSLLLIVSYTILNLRYVYT